MNYQQLQCSELFYHISEEEFKNMLGCVGYYEKTYEKNSLVIMENDNVKYLGVIIKGSVQMIKEDIWGNKTILARLGKGELVGETFVFSSQSRSMVSFVTAEKTDLVFMNLGSVMHTCSRSCSHHQQLSDNLVRVISNKNIRLIEKIEITSKKTLREKILEYLSIQYQKNGSGYFEIPLGRIELAEYLCADRSALTRELNRMRDEGIIDFDKNTFRILNLK